MPVGVAKIDTAPAAFPIVAPFDDDSARSQMRLPTIEFVPADGERHMQCTIAAMAGDGPARQRNGLLRGALAKDQQDIAPGYRISSNIHIWREWS